MMIADPTALKEVDVEDLAEANLDPRFIRMKGHTNHKNIEFDVPLISEIMPGLWQGGCMGTGELVLHDEIVNVINLAPWWNYLPGTQPHSSLSIIMYDAEDQALGQVEALAHWVVSAWEDGSTLVHCQAGLNRSGLVVARALMIKDGLTGAFALSVLRAKRSEAVLCNQSFEDYLLSFDLVESA